MYQLHTKVQDAHIDFQNIVDGLYYPFYFEECRHQCLKEVTGISMEEYAQRGLYLVLAEYTLKYKASLKKDDELIVTCQVVPVEGSRTKFACEQQIICNDKVAAEARFIATCVPAAGGRPFIPDEIKKHLSLPE